MHPLAKGMLDSLSIGIGYLPISFSFGLAALQAGLSPMTAVLISAVVFAGASQFVLVSLLAAGGSFVAVASTVLLMNIRHIFYGPTIISQLGGDRPNSPRALLAFGLTDEVFASAVGKLPRIPVRDREDWYLGLQLGAYLAWVIGTVLGTTLGLEVTNQSAFAQETLSFVLPALFFSLLLEIRAGIPNRVIYSSAIVTAILLPILPGYLSMIAGMLTGAALGYKKTDKK